MLRGSPDIPGVTPKPVWLLEHGFRENFDGKINPHFRDVFEIFWREHYICRTMDRERKLVRPQDVDRWLNNGVRDYGYLNYVFSIE